MSEKSFTDCKDDENCDDAIFLSTSEEDQGRADLFALCARLLLSPPDAEFLALLRGAAALNSLPRATRLDRAWADLVAHASNSTLPAITDEFDRLFISTGTPVVNPNASVYLAGFMHEKPLAALRMDLAGVGLARRPGRGEVEDHLGVLCEIMRMMISGPLDQQQPLARQQQIFETHIGTWYARCLDDITKASAGGFYACVAELVAAFFEIEVEAFRFNTVPDTADFLENAE